MHGLLQFNALRCVLSFLTLFSLLNGEVIQSKSCEQEDVQAAIDLAVDGDIVLVPGGRAFWTSPEVSIAGLPSVKIKEKSIMLLGSGIGKTVIVDSTKTNTFDVPLEIGTSESTVFRISGFTFLCLLTDVKGFIGTGGSSKMFRIDNCQFIRKKPLHSGNAIVTYGELRGVVDHCVFKTDTARVAFKGLSVNGSRDESWKKPLSLGSPDAVYVEGCQFKYQFHYRCLDGDNGGREVFRYNAVYNTDIGTHGYDTSPRSNISLEIYNNKFYHTIEGSWYITIAYRGGTGVIFNNIVENLNGTFNSFAGLYYYCGCPDHQTCGHETCLEYPCKDQPGRAPDTNGDGIQEREPLYEWNNTFAGQDGNISTADICDEVHEFVREGRDFYNNTKRPGYTPYMYPHPFSVPGQVTPVNNSKNIPLSVTVNWSRLLGAQKYRLQVSTDTSFMQLLVDVGGITDTFYTLTALDSSTDYYWRVNEDRNDSVNCWTSAWNFRTVGNSSVSHLFPDKQRGTMFYINVNNREVTFFVELDKTEVIGVEVFTVQGRKIAGLGKMTKSRGLHRLTWSLIKKSFFSGGMFFVKMSAGDMSKTFPVLIF